MFLAGLGGCMFTSMDALKKAGFDGFKTVEELWGDSSMIPKVKGVYLVLRTSKGPVEFINPGTGAKIKKRDPNVSVSELKKYWIEGPIVIYIGKAGGGKTKATLNSRLKAYLGFGRKKKYSHSGGKRIWQIKNAGYLVFCWKELPAEDPRQVERKMISDFKTESRCHPFANCVA